MIEEYGEIPDDETIAAAQSVSQHDDVVSSVAGACVRHNCERFFSQVEVICLCFRIECEDVTRRNCCPGNACGLGNS